MPTRKRRRSRTGAEPPSRAAPSPSLLLRQRSLDLPCGALPVVRLRSVRRHANLFRKLIGEVHSAAGPGDLVAVHTPQGELLGHGLYNPRAEIAVRMLN